MERWLPTLLLAGMAFLPYSEAAIVPSSPDHYLCYKAALARNQPKLPKNVSKQLEDRFGGPQAFDVRKIVAICNPAERDGSLIAHPDIHQEGFAIKAQRGGPKFVKSNHVTVDAFAQRTLTITAPVALLDVTPNALGTTPPAAFASDPTVDPTINRFKCYRAKLAKGSPKFVPPAPPTVTDQFFTLGQQLVVKKVTKLCEPVDKDGETPGAATRPTSLVCYAVKLPPHSPKFVKTTVATNDANFAPHVLVAAAPAELCLSATEPTGKKVFVTSTTTNGGFGGTSGADTFCAGRATAAGLSGTFKAWLSVTGDGPSTRFTQSAVPYRLVDGSIVANDWSDLTDANLAHAINLDESGSAVANAEVWTATTTAGAPITSNNCNNFVDSTASVLGVCGTTALANSSWTTSGTPTCDSPLRLYCFEQ